MIFAMISSCMDKIKQYFLFLCIRNQKELIFDIQIKRFSQNYAHKLLCQEHFSEAVSLNSNLTSIIYNRIKLMIPLGISQFIIF